MSIYGFVQMFFINIYLLKVRMFNTDKAFYSQPKTNFILWRINNAVCDYSVVQIPIIKQKNVVIINYFLYFFPNGLDWNRKSRDRRVFPVFRRHRLIRQRPRTGFSRVEFRQSSLSVSVRIRAQVEVRSSPTSDRRRLLRKRERNLKTISK